jgi:hypothetical protein
MGDENYRDVVFFSNSCEVESQFFLDRIVSGKRHLLKKPPRKRTRCEFAIVNSLTPSPF